MQYRYSYNGRDLLRRYETPNSGDVIMPDEKGDEWDPFEGKLTIDVRLDCGDVEMSEEEVFTKWPHLKDKK